MAKFIRHEGCPKCGSSDSLAIYDDAGAHCFSASCNYHKHGDDDMELTIAATTKPSRLSMGGVVAAIPQRRLSQDTCQRYGVTVEYSTTGEIIRHHYPYYNLSTNEVASAKVREVKTKNFHTSGDTTGVGFFGQHQCKITDIDGPDPDWDGKLGAAKQPVRSQAWQGQRHPCLGQALTTLSCRAISERQNVFSLCFQLPTASYQQLPGKLLLQGQKLL